MDTEKSLVKITTKYHCMVSGQKQMEPCEGCSNPKGCLSKAMQYKENEEMDELNEKAIVKIDADGGVVKCAKGLGEGECGYKAGAKVCGACGAMAVMQKAVATAPEMDAEEEDMPKKPKATEMDAEVEAEDEMKPEEESMDKTWMMKPDKRSRGRVASSMGMKSAELDDDAYICQLERKAYPGSSDICQNCPGGCQAEAGMPGLIDVEGMGLEILGGKVLDSGYSFDANLFVVQYEAKNGNIYEMMADGESGEMLSLQRIPESEAEVQVKSLEDGEDIETGEYDIVTATEAVEIALKSLEEELGTTGEVQSIDADMFRGMDAYAVEVNALDGKSYDMFVSLDGQYLGFQDYTADEVEEIEAEAAEIALKRAYSEESRTSMAEKGTAMPDGSYPIKDVADLRNAIRAYGRAKDKEATKAHIMKRAMALGAEDLIPTNWVPKDVQEKFSSEKSEDASFLASLMEFEVLSQEEELKRFL